MSVLYIIGNGGGDDIHTSPMNSNLQSCIKWTHFFAVFISTTCCWYCFAARPECLSSCARP